MNAPRLYAVFLLWMLSELFENLPEVGDLDQPKLVFFFDEAHLLFAEAPKALLQKIEQVVRLIRSKGVGVFFITQNPLDIPDTVLGQLGNRVQHALRAYTPRDQKAVKAAAETFRANPSLDVAQVIGELGVGEALVSFLDDKGTPQIVQRAFILPPGSQLGPIDANERKAAMAASVVAGVYEKTVDRESAYEKLNGRVAAGAQQAPTPAPASREAPAPQPAPAEEGGSLFGDVPGGLFGKSGKRDTAVQAMVKSAARSIGSQVGREIIRGVLGSIMKKR
jgi:DNA helicase HerA-like ATPase